MQYTTRRHYTVVLLDAYGVQIDDGHLVLWGEHGARMLATFAPGGWAHFVEASEESAPDPDHPSLRSIGDP